MNKYACPACGYNLLEESPRSESGGGSYEICPSCGFQFGVSDDDEGYCFDGWRELWIRNGMHWYSNGVKPPNGWDPDEQLRKAGLRGNHEEAALATNLRRGGRPHQSNGKAVRAMSDHEIQASISKYRDAARKYGAAIKDNDNKEADKQVDAVEGEFAILKRQGREGLEAIAQLLSSEDEGILLWSSAHLLNYPEYSSHAVLEDLKRSASILALTAEVTLDQWKNGELRRASFERSQGQ